MFVQCAADTTHNVTTSITERVVDAIDDVMNSIIETPKCDIGKHCKSNNIFNCVVEKI